MDANPSTNHNNGRIRLSLVPNDSEDSNAVPLGNRWAAPSTRHNGGSSGSRRWTRGWFSSTTTEYAPVVHTSGTTLSTSFPSTSTFMVDEHDDDQPEQQQREEDIGMEEALVSYQRSRSRSPTRMAKPQQEPHSSPQQPQRSRQSPSCSSLSSSRWKLVLILGVLVFCMTLVVSNTCWTCTTSKTSTTSRRWNWFGWWSGRSGSTNDNKNNPTNTTERTFLQNQFPQLVWQPACPEAPYDYIGRLQFCQGPTDQFNNTYYGFRLQSNQSCGGWSGPHGPPPNPVIRMQAGKRYHLILENTAPQDATNLHLHGLHIASYGPADNVLTQSVDAGKCISYHYHVPAHHMEGVHWYHTHLFGRTLAQINGGAFGLLLIDPADENENDDTDQDETESSRSSSSTTTTTTTTTTTAPGPLARTATIPPRPDFVYHQQFIVLFTSKRWAPEPHSDTVVPPSSSRHKKVPHTTVNGLPVGTATLDVPAHQWTRLSLLVVDTKDAVARQVRFDPQACHVHAIAFDGVWRNRVGGESAPESPVFSVTGASRLDVAIQCRRDSGIWYRPTYSDDPTLQETTVEKDEPVLTLKVTGHNNNNNDDDDNGALELWIPPRPSYLQSLLTASETEELHFTAEDTLADGFETNTLRVNITPSQINGVAFYVGIPPLATLHYGTVQQWSLDYTQYHPFHLHGHHMQVVSPGGCGNVYQQGEWFDTIAAGYAMDIQTPCRVRFRLRGDDGAAGPVLFHCHTLDHETAMAWVNVVNHDDDNDNNNDINNHNHPHHHVGDATTAAGSNPNPWQAPGAPQKPLAQCQADACYQHNH